MLRAISPSPLLYSIGAVTDDLDSFFGSAKPSAAPSQANSYAPSPANMASPAASLGPPDSQQDTDIFGSFGSPAQPSARPSPAQQSHHQPPAMDPFDLFGEGSTVSAAETVASGSQQSPADDGGRAGGRDVLFGGIEGHQGDFRLLLLILIFSSTDRACIACTYTAILCSHARCSRTYVVHVYGVVHGVRCSRTFTLYTLFTYTLCTPSVS